MNLSRHTSQVAYATHNRSILVAVDGRPAGWDALGWAAAEAAARRAELRIVHAFRLAQVFDPFGGAPGPQLAAVGAAHMILVEAADRARIIAPDLPISMRLLRGSPAKAILREGRHDSLIVLGRPRSEGRRTRSVTEKVLLRAQTPVAVIGPALEPDAPTEAGRAARNERSADIWRRTA
jgi:nucleotide-binding universal stress UspA family protein